MLNNNFYPYIDGYKGMLKKRGKKVPFEEKGRADSTIVNVFVDRLEDIDKEEYFKKTYEFGKFLYDEINLKTYLQVYIRDNTFFENYNLAAYQVYDKEEYFKKTYEFGKFLYDEINLKTYLQVYIRDNTFFENYNLAAYQVYPPFREREDIKKILEKIKNGINLKTYLQVYIRDNTFFENYNLAAYQVYPPFREREDIKKILEKIKNGEKITEQEKIALTNVFYKSISFKCPTVDFLLFFNKNPLGKYENAELYFRDTENILN